MPSPSSRRWVVLGATESIRWGGDLRRHYVFAGLAERTGAARIPGWKRPSVFRAIRATGGIPFTRRIGWGPRAGLASAEMLTGGALVLARRHFRLTVLDLHDHPIAQAEALGTPHAGAYLRELESRILGNLSAFEMQLVPSASFGELAGVEPARAVVIPNGSDTRRVVPGPFPGVPRIGFVSGAAPGRGIELLIDAARRLRPIVPDLRLALWLAPTDEIGEAYIDGLRRASEGDAWIEISWASYAELGAALASATVLVVPHPANDYLDSAVPIKLLDSMAAGRPVVVTPRRETRLIVERADAGRVAAGDGADDLAAAILPLLEDAELAARLGANGRLAAERDFDWRVLGQRVADAVLERFGPEP